MGWYYTNGCDRNGIIRQILAEHNPERCTVLKHTTYGNQFWCLTQMKDNLGGDTFIELFLLQSGKEYGWGYKPMDEACGPYYYACPLAYLDCAPETNAKWREGVRQWHAKKNGLSKFKLEVGKTYKVAGAWKAGGMPVSMVTVDSLKPLRGTMNGWAVKIPLRMKKDMALVTV